MGIIHIKRTKSDLCSVNFVLPLGQAHDPLDKIGLTHLIEHLLFHAHPLFSQEEMMIKIEEMGGIFNAVTEKEMTVVYGKINKKYINAVINLFSEAIKNLSNSINFIPIEKKILRKELYLQSQMSYYRQMMYHHEGELFKNHPYEKNQFLNNDIESITEKELINFLELYKWENWNIFIVGNIEDHDLEYSLDYNEKNIIPMDNLKISQHKVIEQYNFEESGLIVSIPFPTHFTPLERLVVYNGLFAGISNPFYSHLVTEEALTYDLNLYMHNLNKYKGIQLGWAGGTSDVANSSEAFQTVWGLIQKKENLIQKSIQIGIEKSKTEILLISENFIRYSSHVAKQYFLFNEKFEDSWSEKGFAEHMKNKVSDFLLSPYYLSLYHSTN